MTIRRSTPSLFFYLAALGLALCVALPAAAAPAAGGQHSAARTRPQSQPVHIGSQSSSHQAQPRSQPTTRSSSGDHAVQRSGSGHDLGRRNPPSSRHYHGSYGATIYWGPDWGWGWPWGGWWGWWGWYPYGYYQPAPYYPSRVSPDQGALDLDLAPETAQVYLNGQLIGIADNFDGWPRYLWLDKGTYDLVFYHEGFQTIARQYSIYPGVIVDVEDHMVPGEATPPQDLIAKSTARRDERMRQEAERRKAAEAAEPEWKERVRSERGETEGAPAAPARPYDARVAPARLALTVSPEDAAVYLDGRFLGGADDLAAHHTGVVIDPGDHELEVVRPGYESKTLSFTAATGEEVDLTVELEKSS